MIQLKRDSIYFLVDLYLENFQLTKLPKEIVRVSRGCGGGVRSGLYISATVIVKVYALALSKWRFDFGSQLIVILFCLPPFLVMLAAF